MIPQLATFSALRVCTNVPLSDPEPGVSRPPKASTASNLMAGPGEAGQGVAGLEWAGLELSLELLISEESGLQSAAWSGDIPDTRDLEVSEELRMGEADPDPFLTPP